MTILLHPMPPAVSQDLPPCVEDEDDERRPARHRGIDAHTFERGGWSCEDGDLAWCLRMNFAGRCTRVRAHIGRPYAGPVAGQLELLEVG